MSVSTSTDVIALRPRPRTPEIAPPLPEPKPEPEPKEAQVTLAPGDLSLAWIERSHRVEQLRAAYFRACPEICIERPLLVTRLHRSLGLFAQPRISILDKARVYRRVLEQRRPIVWPEGARDDQGQEFRFAGNSLFAGTTTSKFKGVLIYPELLGLALWPELHTLPTRSANPYQIKAEEAEVLNTEVFPHWLDHTILEQTRSRTAADPPAERPDFDLLQSLVFFLASKPNCISHTIPDFSRAVHQGLRALIDEAQDRRRGATSDATRIFYAALVEVLEGIIAYAHNLAAQADLMAGSETDPGRKAELLQLAAIHRRVPELPARTLREGLTTVWLCWIACHLENPNVGLSLGRLDQLLFPLYRADRDAGRLSVEEAVELCCCLWLKIGDHVPSIPRAAEQLFGGTGSNQAITIGGVDAQGRDAVNDLTYIMLRATELMQLRDPNLNARYMPGVNSRDYLRRLCLANLKTGATPALHNDRAVIEALRAAGDTPEQACDYGIIGCVEPGSCGRYYGHSAAILLNLPSVLELTLFKGCHRHTGLDHPINQETGDPATFRSFDEFRAAFTRQLEWLAKKAVGINNALGRTHQLLYPTPILSALFEGPMQKGKDVIEGGATINASSATIIGLADTSDSLSAIEQVVFNEKSLSLGELIAALKDNFVGHEALAKRLAEPRKTPKWGNENALADANTAWLVALLDRVFAGHSSYRDGARYRVGYWSMTNHAGFGRLLGAMPNGRQAGENLSSGFTPVSGVTPELTPALNSVGKIPPRYLTSGVAFNLKFTPAATRDDPAMLERFTDTVEAFFSGQAGSPGGMEIQFNITRREDFIDAIAHPQRHTQLLVRVSGYTAYFKDLTPEMQKEIIDRTEYLLSTGGACFHKPFRLVPDAHSQARESQQGGGSC